MTEGPPFVPHEYVTGALAWVSRTIRELGPLQHPILGEFRHEVVHDLPRERDGDGDADLDVVLGHALSTSAEPHEETEPGPDDLRSPLFRTIGVTHEFVVTHAQILEFDVDSLLATVYEMSDEMASQQLAGMLEHLEQVLDDAGQVVNAEGRSIFDALNDALETMEIEIDEDGGHNLSILMHPDTAREFSTQVATPEQIRRHEEILRRKREEQDAARRPRELP